MTVSLPAEREADVLAQQSRPPQRRLATRSLQSRFTSLHPAHVLTAALVLAIAASRLGSPKDPDVWWHLRAGEWILDHHRLPGHALWTINADSHSWVAHEWLSQVLLALAYRADGYHGVTALRTLGVVALLSVLAVQCFRRTTPWRGFGLVVLLVLATSGGWGERPQLVSFLLLIPTATLLRRAVARGRLPWELIPLTWVWANLHGLWILAVVLTVAFALGHLLDERTEGVSYSARLIAIALGMTAAAGLTPNGPALLTEPLRVQGYGRFVAEWAPPSIHSQWGFGLYALLGIYGVTLARSRKAQPWTTLLPVLVGTVVAVSYIRTIAPGVIILAPYIAAAVGRAEGKQQPMPASMRRATAAAMAAVVVAGIVVGGWVSTHSPGIPANAPVAATRVLNTLPGQQRVINDYTVGGWLLWAAPSARLAIDGRTEIYDISYVGDYLDALKMSGNWEQTILGLRPTVAFLNKDTPVVNGLREVLHWRTLKGDGDWLVLVPPPASGVKTHAGAP